MENHPNGQDAEKTLKKSKAVFITLIIFVVAGLIVPAIIFATLNIKPTDHPTFTEAYKWIFSLAFALLGAWNFGQASKLKKSNPNSKLVGWMKVLGAIFLIYGLFVTFSIIGLVIGVLTVGSLSRGSKVSKTPAVN